MRPSSLGIIGLGCIGGSVAWAAREAGIGRILGWSPLPAERVAAVKRGALDDSPNTPEDVARQAELLVLAAPPAANLHWLETLAPTQREGAFVTDTGSVKRAVVACARSLGRLGGRFAGSHPLAGSHESGFATARPGLFQEAVVYVTPVSDGPDDAAREIAHFWETVAGAHPVMISADRHDAQLAVTSHLPQALSSLLARALSQTPPAPPPPPRPPSPPGRAAPASGSRGPAPAP